MDTSQELQIGIIFYLVGICDYSRIVLKINTLLNIDLPPAAGVVAAVVLWRASSEECPLDMTDKADSVVLTKLLQNVEKNIYTAILNFLTQFICLDGYRSGIIGSA